MSVEQITPLVLTLNEDTNLRRTLESLRWAKEVVVLDSFSTDGTAAITGEFSNVRFLQRVFDTHSAQWNAGVEACATPWVLALDADYVLSDHLVEELQSWSPDPNVTAYFTRFRYCVYGRPLKGSLYPPRAVLFQKRASPYEQDGHTQILRIEGPTAWLRGHIDHDDRKPLSRWLQSQERYARLEAEKMTLAAGKKGWPDRLRRAIWPAAPAAFLYTLFAKGLILDGWPGWFYALQRTYAELLLSLHLLERRLANREVRTRKID